MGNDRLIRIVGTIASFVFVIVMFVAGAFLIKNEIRSTDSANRDINAQRLQAMEDAKKLDPEGQKVVLSQDYLKEEYKCYYQTAANARKSFNKVWNLALGFMAIICVGSAVLSILRARRKGESLNPLRMIASVLPLVFIAFFMIFSNGFMKQTDPKPEKAEIQLYKMEVLRKESKTTYDDDGDETTTYYIYFKGNNGTEQNIGVTSSMYDTVTDPGLYYIAVAKESSKQVYFCIFATDNCLLPEQI